MARPLKWLALQRRLRLPQRLPGTGAFRSFTEEREEGDAHGLEHPDQYMDTVGQEGRQTKDDYEDQFELMEWQSPWPFVSAADLKLCELSAGPHWPWKPSMASMLQDASEKVRPELQIADPSVDAMLAGLDSKLDLPVVARTASDSNREDLWEWLHERKAMLQKCHTGSLAVILSSLTRASGSSQRSQGQMCRDLLRHVANEMLQRRLSPRHALVMLGALKVEVQGGDCDEKPVSVPDLLALVSDTLQRHEDGGRRLPLADVISALEGLAALRSTQLELQDVQRNRVLSLAKLLICELHGGLGLSLLLAQSGQSQSGQNQGSLLRLLAALAHFPEAAGPTAKWLAALGGVRWTREATASQETTAAAAFVLSRCGAWASARAGYLLSQALRRDAQCSASTDASAESTDDSEGSGRPFLVEDSELITATAGSWWLAAVAQSGMDIESAVGFEALAERAPTALFAAAKRLGTEAESGAKVRALWALHALGKASEEQELADSLLQQLAESDSSGFSPESWWLLREMQPVMKPSQEEEEEEEAEGGETRPFSKWKDELTRSLEAERATWTSERGEELARVVQDLGASGDDAVTAFLAEPFCLALHWPHRGKALDLDDHQSPVTRVLRRQHWAAILPEVEVKEVSLAEWDEDGGKNRLLILQDLLGGEPPE